MMDWILLSALGSAALLLTELYDFIRDRGSDGRPWTRNESLPVVPPVCAAAEPQRMPLVATIRAVTQAADRAIDNDGWQTTARRLAGQWTALDGVIFHHDAHAHDISATEIARRRTLSPDQILSARITAAYAVWTAARSSQVYGE